MNNAVSYDGPVTISVGDSRRSIQWKNKELLWSELVHKLSIPQRTHETTEEYKGMRKPDRDALKDVGGFVGGIIKGGRRKAEAVQARRLLTLDLDSCVADDDPWFVVAMIIGCAAVLYSTHSSTADAPRVRIVIPLSREVNSEEYAALSRRVAADIGIDMCDDTTYEPHRLMYWPSCSQDAKYTYKVSDGPWLDVDEQLARYHDWHDTTEWPTSSRQAQIMQRMASKQKNPIEKEGIVGAFCQCYSVEEAIEEFLPEVYTKGTDGRYSFSGGSTTGGLILYEDGLFAYSHHGTDPASGKLCNAFDLVRIHLFGDKDATVLPDTPIAKCPSFTAMAELAKTLPAVQEALAEMRYKKFVSSFDTDDMDDPDTDKEWLKTLTLSDKGAVEQTVNNAFIVLRNDPALKNSYFRDDFKERMVVCGDLPWQAFEAREDTSWNDTDDAGAHSYLEHKYGLDNILKIREAIELAMNECRRHPVREYLQGLAWDGVERCDTLFIDYLGADNSEYVRTVTRKALIGAVARILSPGCKHDHMLVLVGPQGCRKSTTLQKLGKTWFSDSLYTVNGKEAYEQVQGFWIIEMGEMAATRKAELEQIKQFISKQSDSYRAAYARRTLEHPRQCAFFGTTNDDEFLRDPTGGRRFWPVTVTDAGREKGDGLTAEIVDQIWAEALARYNAGETWHLDERIELEARKVQMEHTEMNSKQGIIELFLQRLLPAGWASYTLEQRKAYWCDGFEDEKQNGTEMRASVCAVELHVECFGGDLKNYSPQLTREYNSIMRRLPGWRAVSCINTIYGKQRGFVFEGQKIGN